MAERRMFSKSVVNSARFLRMPQTSRLLYYDLGMCADDDGIVEAFTVIRTTGAAEDDLRVLATRGFVTILDEDLVSYIRDWTTNNQIRKDRYTPSLHADLLVKLTDGNGSEDDGLPDGNQVATNGLPLVDQRLTQYSIGEYSRVKVRVDKESVSAPEAPPSPQPHSDSVSKKDGRRKYGVYGWVKLTDEQHSRLLQEMGEEELNRCITYVDESAQGNGNKNRWKDWNLVIRRCHRDGWGLRENSSNAKGKPAKKYCYSYDGEDTL